MIKILMMVSVFLLVLATSTLAAPRTMRLDYYHTGDARQETFSLDRVVLDLLRSGAIAADANKTRTDVADARAGLK